MQKRYKLVGGQSYPVILNRLAVASSDTNEKLTAFKYVGLPPVITPDIVVFEGKYVESGPNLNKAYFDQVELVKAYNTIAYKPLDREHEMEDIVGHIYASKFVDRKTQKELFLEELLKMDEAQLRSFNIDVMVGGVVYIERFPALEGPMSRKARGISMETWFSDFQLLLSNGIKVTRAEAEALGWGNLVDQMLSQHNSLEALEAAHTVKVILADKSEVPMQVFKWLEGISFSGGGLVDNPACPKCLISLTNKDLESAVAPDCMDECKTDKDPEGCMDECDMMGSAAAFKAQADQMLTINLTKLDSYMAEWRKSSQGKPLNHQVKDNLFTLTTTDDADEDAATADMAPVGGDGPPIRHTDPRNPSRKPSICPQYKYEIWVQQGDADEEQKRHWCIYGNDKCPTAGDRTFHECMRWYKRENDWIMDLRTFRDVGNPFAPDGYDQEAEDSIMMQSSSLDFKRMDAMVDSFLYQVEALRLEKEIAEKEQRKERAAVWTTQYVNGLPNSSFACVEKGYKEGESPKTARHLPFKDAQGTVDLPHLRNALARVNQIKSVLGNEGDTDLRKRAVATLERYRSKLSTE